RRARPSSCPSSRTARAPWPGRAARRPSCLVVLRVPAAAPHGVLALRGRGVRDPGGLLLRRALVAQRLVHVGLLDRRRGVLAWHGSSFSRALDRTRVPFGAVGSGEGRADLAGGRPPARRRAPTGAPRESPSIGLPASQA